MSIKAAIILAIAIAMAGIEVRWGLTDIARSIEFLARKLK